MQAAGWHLDCSAEFVPGEEKPLFASLVSSAPDESIVTLEEPDIVVLPPPPPTGPRVKGRAKKTAIQAFSQVVIRSTSKTPVEHPPFHGDHLSLLPLLHQMSPLVLLRPLVHNLLLPLLTVALLFSPCLARERLLSWIRVPHLWRRLTRLLSLKVWTWCNSCWILSLQEVPSQHRPGSKSSLPRFVCFSSSFFRLLSF